jgi:HPt (histidine-containing phosphotransfer) domain-containing protein
MKNERKLINIEEALERFGGEKDLYDSLALMFIEDSDFECQKLDLMLKENNIDQACSYVHKLKGVCGTLGCELLFDSTKDFCDIARKRISGDINACAQQVKNNYEITMKKFFELYQK